MAQTTGSIRGVVTDATEAVVPGATVTISSPALIGGTREAVTNELGVYRFPSVPSGTYTVEVAMPGFMATRIADVDVRGQDVKGVFLPLQPGGTLAGRVVFDVPAAAIPGKLDGIRVTLIQSGGNTMALSGGTVFGSALSAMEPVSLVPDGTFRIIGIGPASYTLNVMLPQELRQTWRVRSAMVDGLDLLDSPPDGILFRLPPEAGDFRVVLRQGEPRFTAAWDVAALCSRNRLRQKVSVRCAPAGPGLSRLTVQSIPPPDREIRWSIAGGTDTTVVAQTRRDTPAGAGAPAVAEWELEFSRPLAQSFSLESTWESPSGDFPTIPASNLISPSITLQQGRHRQPFRSSPPPRPPSLP